MRVLRIAPLIATLLVLGLGAGFLVAQAREPADEPEGPPPAVTWNPSRITGTVTQTTTFTATATVSPTVTNNVEVECVVRPKKFDEADLVGCSVSSQQQDGTVTVTLTVTPTEEIHGRAFNFQVFLRLDGEKRVLAPPLQVRLFTRDDEGRQTPGASAGKGDQDDDSGGRPDSRGDSHRPEFSPPGPPSRAGGDDDHPGNRGQSAGEHGNGGGRRGR
jgi:hypothetical protein